MTVRDWRWGTKAPFWELLIHLECSDSLHLVWDCLLRKTNTAIFYHVYRITALAYTKHYSLQLIPLTLKTQACTYSGAVEKASVWEDYGYCSDAQHFLVKIVHCEAITPLSLQCISICFSSSAKVFLKIFGVCKAFVFWKDEIKTNSSWFLQNCLPKK